jgi:hypothetical protein
MANANQRRCKATSRSGERCRAHVVNAAGYCVAHDPEKPMDMRALGRKSGEARRRPDPERVPASLRQELQKLDPAIVRGAIERALAGDNESARVSAVKLLADVDAFSRNGGCPVCAEAAAEAEAHARRTGSYSPSSLSALSSRYSRTRRTRKDSPAWRKPCSTRTSRGGSRSSTRSA